MKRVYFDNAATTPIEPEVIREMTEVMTQHFGNPSSIYAEGRASRALVEQARKEVANALGASIGEIFFTSGGTESTNMALKCSVRDLGVERIITSRTEHHCVLHSLARLQEANPTLEVIFLDNDAAGNPSLAQLEEHLPQSGKKTLVSLMHSNNEIGTMIDLQRVSDLCAESGAYFHSDTVQTIGYYPIDVSTTQISFLTGSAHKFYGPKGVGFIYINGDNIVRPLVDGGSQERNMRAGTENLYGVVGLAKALTLAVDQMQDRRNHIERIRNRMIEGLQQHFAGLRFNGNLQDNTHFKVLSVSFPPSPRTELLLLNLDIAGISVSGGSACSSGAESGSHVIDAIGEDPGRKTIRFSFSHHNTVEEVDYVLSKLKEFLPGNVTDSSLPGQVQQEGVV